MRIVIISDTHGFHNKISIPYGDVFIHAGDFCNFGTFNEARKFAIWLNELPHKYKIIIAGNHDIIIEKDSEVSGLIFGGIAEYLQDSGTEIKGIKFYGCPYQPEFNNWAFNLPRKSKRLKNKWDKICDDVDILITHTPPFGILDKNYKSEHCGCELLRERIEEIQPKIHIFGHVHENYGMTKYNNSTYINASFLNLDYTFNKVVKINV